jgi:hypothetical protein
MRQTRRRDRRSLGQTLFAPRQIYLRDGPHSQYVTLSRRLQIGAATGMAVIALWLGVATYAAVAKHLETVEQGRELARLESIARSLRASVQEPAPGGTQSGGAAALISEVAERQAGGANAR